MFFVPCIVIQLCNVNQQMHTFLINVFIQLLASSTCFEHHVFISRKTICICSFVWYVFHTEITIKLYKISKYEMLSFYYIDKSIKFGRF